MSAGPAMRAWRAPRRSLAGVPGRTIVRLAFVAMLGGALLAAAPAAQPSFTPWGWPQPYERVSQKSIDWLKGRGWWPLQYGYQSLWLGQATVALIIKDAGLDAKRGLDIQLQTYLAGPPLNDAIIAGWLQVGSGGDLPLTTLIAHKVPVRSPGVVWTPLLEHAILVPFDSPVKKAADLKGKTVGLVVGSSAQFALFSYLRAHGIDSGEVTLKSMSVPEQVTMPRSVDAVLPWAPTPGLMARSLKNARILDDLTPLHVYWGSLYLREEIFEYAPDVVEAVVDMAVEATLIARRDVKAAAELTRRELALAGSPREHVLEETVTAVSALKPTWIYPFVDVYASSGVRVAKFLLESGRLYDPPTEQSFRDWFRGGTRWMDTTFRKLGWAIPKEPPFFPVGLTTGAFLKAQEAGQRPPMLLPYKLDKPQPFPEPGDLERRWHFDGRWYEPRK